MTDTNPLLDFGPRPAFDRINAEHVAPAVQTLLAQAEAALERAVGPEVDVDYEAMSAVLDVAAERLERAWGQVGHLHAVADTPEMRAAYSQSLGAVTAFHTRISSDRRLMARYQALRQQDRGLTPARRRALDNALRDFELSGAMLDGADRERFAQIKARRAELAQQFSEHVMDATDAFSLDVPASQLAGLPADALAAAREAAQAAGVEGCRLTLHAPSYLPAMQHVHDREVRQALYRAYVTRASEHGPPEQDNTAIIQEQLTLKQEEARLLGRANYAQVSLAPKMAGSPQEVLDFLRLLAQRARPSAHKDFEELKAFAAAELALADLQAWDVPYASERLRERRYAYSEEEVRAYFTLPRVLQGLFEIIETLFGVRIVEDQAPVWHDSVKFYRIEQPAAQAGDAAPTTVAHFYLDLHARPGKSPGAWMSDAQSRWRRPDGAGAVQTPVARLICNFASPLGGRPALLTHDDVITLFHEFGHGLHHMLTQVEDLAVSGIAGVEWDAVELPSQFMENFCWEWSVLRRLTAHVDTGQALPRELFDKLLAAKNFQSGLATLRQIEFGLFDMRLHAEPGSQADVQRVMDEVRAEVALLHPPAFNRFQNAFSHIFGGGYAAGYYSYKWAEVLSADAWSAFEETDPLDLSTGQRYLKEILAAGGSRPALESFKAFRGREPQIDALLRHQGLA
ncbi:MAG: M3 family metallopeptidase [Betaproteobacteria bacterium]